VTDVFGRAVSANADPVEKKPLFHFYPGSVAFSIATRGCNFHCLHCQNWSISQAAREDLDVPDFALPPASVVSAALAAGSRSIAYTYTEPTVFIEYVVATARLAAAAGLANVLVSPTATDRRGTGRAGSLVQAANVDLKSFDDRLSAGGGARLAPVLETLTGMKERRHLGRSHDAADTRPQRRPGSARAAGALAGGRAGAGDALARQPLLRPIGSPT
jgi:pyruvate formate lyase activating enzyme